MMNAVRRQGGGGSAGRSLDQDCLALSDRPHELSPGRPDRSWRPTVDWANIWRRRTSRRTRRATICSISRSRTASSAPWSRAWAPPGLTTEKDGQWRRVVIEKPFGHDLASAKALNAEILKTLQESQIYRIDHFLGKETVQNIMALRFANGLFEPSLESRAYRSYPDHRRRNRGRGAARQILREDRRAARHGAQPRAPAARDDGDGAAEFLRRRRRAREEGRGHPGDTAARPGAGAAGRRARPIRRRRRHRRAGPGLSPRARRRARLGDRDLHRVQVR